MRSTDRLRSSVEREIYTAKMITSGECFKSFDRCETKKWNFEQITSGIIAEQTRLGNNHRNIWNLRKKKNNFDFKLSYEF